MSAAWTSTMKARASTVEAEGELDGRLDDLGAAG